MHALTLVTFAGLLGALQLRVTLQAPRAERTGASTALDRSSAQAEDVAPRNVVLILADDLVGAYAEGSSPPCTPNVDALAANGLLFRNAWANPVCSPTRGTVLTGRHPFRHGYGSPGAAMGSPGLLLSELTIPELLPASSAALGKWHLQGSQDDDHPNDSGFWRYAGNLGGAVGDYSMWAKTIDGATSITTTYATSDTADEAILAAQTLPQPFFLYVSFNAPHTPFHVPPATLCDQPEACTCDSLGGSPTSLQQGKAMVEAMDRELGRMLEGIRAVAPDPLIVFLGDNGSARQLTVAPFVPTRAKGTMYEGGVNVPLIVEGPGVAQGECAALVSASDLFATFAEWHGVASTAEDSVSMVPYFTNPALPSLRTTIYAETFEPNGAGPYTTHDRAVRDERYKLIRRIGQPDELYDLDGLDREGTDLFPTLVTGTAAHDAYLALVQVLVDFGTD